MKQNLTDLLKRIYTSSFVFIFYKSRWLIQYLKCRRKTYSKNDKNSAQKIIISDIERVLFLIPHADDELVGCFQLIQNLKAKCRFFYFGFTGSDSTDTNKIARFSELKILCETMKIDLYISKGDHFREIELTISEFLPTIIVAPSFIDWHEEHINSNKILREVLLKKELNPKILMYQISVPISGEIITHFLPLSHSEQNSKWKFFYKIYNSQKHIPVYRFKLQEKLNGVILGYYAAEVYVLLNLKDWNKYMVKMLQPFYKDQLHNLYRHINNIKVIREISSKLYTSVFNYQ